MCRQPYARGPPISRIGIADCRPCPAKSIHSAAKSIARSIAMSTCAQKSAFARSLSGIQFRSSADRLPSAFRNSTFSESQIETMPTFFNDFSPGPQVQRTHPGNLGIAPADDRAGAAPSMAPPTIDRTPHRLGRGHAIHDINQPTRPKCGFVFACVPARVKGRTADCTDFQPERHRHLPASETETPGRRAQSRFLRSGGGPPLEKVCNATDFDAAANRHDAVGVSPIFGIRHIGPRFIRGASARRGIKLCTATEATRSLPMMFDRHGIWSTASIWRRAMRPAQSRAALERTKRSSC